jgi:hypothetical protein
MTMPHSPCRRIVLLSCAALLAACGSSSSDGDGDNVLDLDGFGAKYKLADNEVSGWAQKTTDDAFAVYSPASLTQKIDGAADAYVQKGMKYAMFQSLAGPDEQDCMQAMDMTTEANAQAILAVQKQANVADMAIPPYDTSVAIASDALTGIKVLAYFKALYVELSLDGFGTTDHAPAREAAAKLLAAMEAKSK